MDLASYLYADGNTIDGVVGGRGTERDKTRKKKTDGGRNCIFLAIFRTTHP